METIEEILSEATVIQGGLQVRTKPQAPRPLQHWLASSFVAG